MDSGHQNVWKQVDWYERLNVEDVEEDAFLIFKQNEVLTPFDTAFTFDMD
jgi:hypothetical protein